MSWYPHPPITNNISQMANNKTIITTSDLQSHHIGKRAYSTDAEYVALAQTLQEIIKEFVTNKLFTATVIKDLAIRLALHVEDVVADAGVWRSFCTEHKKLYKWRLPFNWDRRTMQMDQVSAESCAFIIWMTLSSYDKMRYVNPCSSLVLDLADEMYMFLTEVTGQLSINEEMLIDLYSDERLSDFYRMRAVLSWLGDPDGCYMSNWDLTRNRADDFRKTYKEYITKEDHLNYEVRSVSSIMGKVGPLALLPQEWYAIMLKSFKRMNRKDYAKKVQNIKLKRFDNYYVEDFKDGAFALRGLDGARFTVKQDSLGDGTIDWDPENRICISAFACYDGVWRSNGITLFCKYSDDFDKEVRKHRLSERSKKYASQIVEKVVEKNDGCRLFYFHDMDEMVRYFDLYLPNAGMPAYFSKFPDYIKNGKNILCYVGEVGDMEFTLGTSPYLCDPHNPFYDEETSCRKSFDILENVKYIGPECIQYMIKNGHLGNLRFPGGDAMYSHMIAQENIDFLARFYRRNRY